MATGSGMEKRLYRDVGSAAWELLSQLSSPPATSGGDLWKRESVVIEDLDEFETEYALVSLSTNPTEAKLRLHADIQSLGHTFHTALPYGEAERRWLLDQYRNTASQFVYPPDHGTVIALVGQHEERIVSSGQRQLVRGQDLIDRWLAWRREEGAFHGQGTLDVALEALRGLYHLCAPGDESREDLIASLPESYLDRRTIQ